jgi:cytochrome c biogenesis protein CcmG/thiol:disulfide interchange protein DsbE
MPRGEGIMARLRILMLQAVLGVVVCLGLAATASAQSTTLDLDAFKGRVVYLDFWASWCVPCRKSFPWLQGLKNSYERDGLSVLAIDVDSDRTDADRFLLHFHPSFDVRFDPRGALAEQFKLVGMPTSVLIDRHGVQRYRHIGFEPADAPSYEKQVRELLAER